MGLYEHSDQEPLSRWQFAQRMARHAAVAGLIVFGSLVFGMVGFERFARMTWGDSFLNAAMLLGGMGQVGVITTRSGKLFSALFALYSAMIFLVVLATVFTPVIHRVLHRFYWDTDRIRSGSSSRRSLG